MPNIALQPHRSSHASPRVGLLRFSKALMVLRLLLSPVFHLLLIITLATGCPGKEDPPVDGNLPRKDTSTDYRPKDLKKKDLKKPTPDKNKPIKDATPDKSIIKPDLQKPDTTKPLDKKADLPKLPPCKLSCSTPKKTIIDFGNYKAKTDVLITSAGYVMLQPGKINGEITSQQYNISPPIGSSACLTVTYKSGKKGISFYSQVGSAWESVVIPNGTVLDKGSPIGFRAKFELFSASSFYRKVTLSSCP